MLKHIGKHGDRKVAIIFREIPDETHMALVLYTETMPVAMHDSLIKVIESQPAQQAESLGDVLFRELFNDGRPMLQTLHTEGMLKKVQTKLIIVTPNANSHVHLDELNKILSEMATGKEAIDRMAKLDSEAGMTGKSRPRDDFGREIGAPAETNPAKIAGSDAEIAARVQAPADGALSDDAIAANLLAQSAAMQANAKSLLAESKRMAAEAKALAPKKTAVKKRTTATKARKKTVANESSN